MPSGELCCTIRAYFLPNKIGLSRKICRMMAKIRTLDGNAGDMLCHSDLTYQFERSGYFALDSSSAEDELVFNRVVTLRDTWTAAGNQRIRSKGKGGNGGNDGRTGKKRGGGGQNQPLEDIRRVALRAGTILEARQHPEADTLIVCKVDVGDVDETGAPLPRTVVAGLAQLDFDTLINRKVVVLANLKPAKMRGIESHAMLLAASDDKDTVELIDVPDSVPNGELLSFEGKELGEPDAMLKSKGALKVWDRVKAKLRVNGSGEAMYEEEDSTVRLISSSAGPVTVASLTDCRIG